MPIRCPNCGHDNRDTANFCVICKGNLQSLKPVPLPPSSSPPQKTPTVPPQGPIVPQTQQPPASNPGLWAPQSQKAPMQASPLPTAPGVSGPIVAGVIQLCNENEVYPPPDRNMIAMQIGLIVLVLPIILYIVAIAGAAAAVILFFGGGFCLVAFGFMFALFGGMIKPFLPRLPPRDRKITQVSLAVVDASGMQHTILLYGDHVAGMLHKGEVVEVYGQRDQNGIIYAERVEVIGMQLGPGTLRRVIPGRRKLPHIVAIGVWVLAVALWFYLISPIVLR